ncbi:hypothetical protein ANN_16842 [Periplaneta americana]|uniref:Uncharacterized protein n=1 Tax=Periplaneta americana TaxID=6978 RepID=A0ABQ8STD5_PERAM|nr:hypothetical protein ANN_16842 [Periplaneta americana]
MRLFSVCDLVDDQSDNIFHDVHYLLMLSREKVLCYRKIISNNGTWYMHLDYTTFNTVSLRNMYELVVVGLGATCSVSCEGVFLWYSVESKTLRCNLVGSLKDRRIMLVMLIPLVTDVNVDSPDVDYDDRVDVRIGVKILGAVSDDVDT